MTHAIQHGRFLGPARRDRLPSPAHGCSIAASLSARSRHSLAAEGARYWGVGISSCALNYAVYSLLLLIDRNLAPLLALVCASACALMFSYTGYSRLVFAWQR
ncbi:MAG TPA: GtrA family protein [Pararhizobium sp.]|nr:GtrA family protein [Pararhizobium sp.]